jgi:hypothetical protein
VVLFEQKKIPLKALDIVFGREKKDDFLPVNWEHPRVRAILTKMRKLIPQTNESLQSYVEDVATGKLADNYMTNEGDDAPLPETLPGIKLVRPWDSLIKKYERMTGKKIEEPHDPTFNPRPEKANHTKPTSEAVIASSQSPTKARGWLWLSGLVLALPILYGIWLYRKHKPA